jgi:hypothetical protein
MKNYKTGDLFVFPLRATGEWMCARIMLDIHRQCVQPALIETGSPLYSFPKALLVEIYRPVFSTSDVTAGAMTLAEVLVPGMFVSTGCFEKGVWHIIGHREVDPAAVEFPETLVNKGAKAYFVRGEVELPVEISFRKIREINAYKTEYPCGILGEIALYQLGRADEIDKPEVVVKLRGLGRSDLRFSKYRGWIYERLGEEAEQSYHQVSNRTGHDLSRFYD